MLESVFSRLTALVGILTGVLGIAAVAGVGVAVILNAISALLWLFLVGLRLSRLDGKSEGDPIIEQ
jgi:Na+/alanine symporter